MTRHPALFLGHGNPMNALTRNAYSDVWRALGTSLPRPRAILCVSAHWYVRGTHVTAQPRPPTIHDFAGFPPELSAFDYPAPGDPGLAREVAELLAPLDVALDESWGLDHGAWSVLAHLHPSADVPVVQLSLDRTQPPSFHYELGRKLSPLRDSGVLILGSGNVVHDLRTFTWEAASPPYDWAARFDATVRDHVTRRDHAPLVAYDRLGADARLSIPTPDHYLPLLHVLGAAHDDDGVSFPVEGIDGGSIGMRAVLIG